MRFNYDIYPAQLEDHRGMSVKDTTWQTWFLSGKPTDKVIEYRNVVDGDKHDYVYRTWYPEATVAGSDLGMLVSVKIDYDRLVDTDDHMVLLAGFDRAGKLFIAQAATSYHGNSKSNVQTKPVSGSTNHEVADGIRDANEAAVTDAKLGGHHDTVGRTQFGTVARANLLAMGDCIEL